MNLVTRKSMSKLAIQPSCRKVGQTHREWQRFDKPEKKSELKIPIMYSQRESSIPGSRTLLLHQPQEGMLTCREHLSSLQVCGIILVLSCMFNHHMANTKPITANGASFQEIMQCYWDLSLARLEAPLVGKLLLLQTEKIIATFFTLVLQHRKGKISYLHVALCLKSSL